MCWLLPKSIKKSPCIMLCTTVTLIRVKGDCYNRISPATMMLTEGSISKSTFSKGDKCQWILISPNYENMLLRIDIKHLRTYPTKHCTDGSYFILPNGNCYSMLNDNNTTYRYLIPLKCSMSLFD